MHYSWHKIETNYTDILSEFTEKTRFEDIPPEVVERAKMIMLQTIGVSLAAKDVPGTKKAAEMALAANGGAGGTATGWVSGDRLAPANAAFLAGALSDMLDWEDTSWTGHPACGIVPCAWVEAEHLKKSGKDLLTAIVLGYEVYQRIACAVQPTLDFQQEHGWGLTSWQIFGCIIPAVKLMGLDANAINKAIGLGTACSTLPTCLHEFTMSDFYHYEHGLRARDGIVIADLVQKGVHNFMDGLDDPAAYANLMTDHYDPSWYTRELGETWLTMTTLLKHWPANMWVQTPAELASEIIFGNGLRKEDIREIIVDPPRMSRMDLPPEGGFKSLTHAQFSIPYVISAMLHDPTPGVQPGNAEQSGRHRLRETGCSRKLPAGPPGTGLQALPGGLLPHEDHDRQHLRRAQLHQIHGLPPRPPREHDDPGAVCGPLPDSGGPRPWRREAGAGHRRAVQH